VAQSRRGIALDPGAFYPQWTLLQALMVGPDPKEGIAVGQPMLARFGRHPWVLMGMAYANGAAGRREAAAALHDELEARARGEYVQPMALAVAAVGAGRKDQAYDHLREAARVRDPLLTAMALHWPGLASLRGEPEYVAVMRLIGWDLPAIA
jgi:hypothetical protein